MSTRSFIPTAGVHERAGEPFRFDVESRTNGKTQYLVDLEQFDWNGFCGCQFFEFSCLPFLTRGAFPAASLRCWHINRARDHFLRSIGPKLAAEYYRNVEKNAGTKENE